MEELKNTLDEVQSVTEGISQGAIPSEFEKGSDVVSKVTEEKGVKTRKTRGGIGKKQGEGMEKTKDSPDTDETEKKSQKKSSKTSSTTEKRGGKPPSYTVEECGKKARQLGTSREVVLIALREAGKKEGDLVTYAEAKVIIRTFLKREVL